MKSSGWMRWAGAGLVAVSSFAVVTGTSEAAEAGNAKPFRIGVIVDMSGVYAGIGGKEGVTAVQMAARDFGGKVLGRPVEILSADYQGKVDVAATRVRSWYDQDDVQAVLESTDSAAALAMQKIGADKKKITIFAGSATTDLTGKACTPYGVHYVYDTYSLANGTARALVKQGYKNWYFVTADYAFGHSLQDQATRVVKSMGGTVLGSVNHPLSASDFASYLMQAQAAKPQVIGLADAGRDTQNAIKQAAEFGLSQNHVVVAPLLIFDGDLKGLGLKTAQGLQFTTAFYWDRNDETRAFAKRFYAATGKMPTMVQAGMYSAAMHYLQAVRAVGSADSDKVMAQMRATPINDFFAKDGRIEANGLMAHDMYLAEAKKPSESKGPWDLLTIRATIPKNEAFQPVSESGCPLVGK